MYRRKYVKRSKSELSRQMEEDSSDSLPGKRHKQNHKTRSHLHLTKKNKEEKRNEPSKTEKKEMAPKKATGGYCIDCNMSIGKNEYICSFL